MILAAKLRHRVKAITPPALHPTLRAIAGLFDSPRQKTSRRNQRIWNDYHHWYYDTGVWTTTRYLGHRALKSVSDLWNYQEILFDLKPGLVVEFGSKLGGSALYLSNTLKLVRPDSLVLAVDITLELVPPELRNNPHIEFMESSSTSPAVAVRIRELRTTYPGPIFAILDSDHAKPHVLAELELLRDVTRTGDYVIVEDSNINGHPVLPGWGEGPYEALSAYLATYPDDYQLDRKRERKFGFSFATRGFLVRT